MDKKSNNGKNYLDDRVKTAAICLPVLFYMLSNKVLLTILLIGKILFSFLIKNPIYIRVF